MKLRSSFIKIPRYFPSLWADFATQAKTLWPDKVSITSRSVVYQSQKGITRVGLVSDYRVRLETTDTWSNPLTDLLAEYLELENAKALTLA